MAQRLKRPCNHPGCRELVEKGYCEKHRRQATRLSDQRRGSSNDRGYDWRWRKYSELFIRRPENVFCAIKLPGCTRLAECTDHIVPPRDKDDPLFWDANNHQPACIHCNSVKGRKIPKGATWTEIMIVCGSPGSGKTTYAKKHMRRGELIVDLDWLWQALTGLKYYEKPEGLLPYVLAAREGVLKQLESPGECKRAWVIISAPKAEQREELARRFRNSKVIVLDVPIGECLSRIANDERRASVVDSWEPIVRRWHSDYTAREGDTVIKG